MRITFVGNFDVPFSTESHHKWTYEKLGHEVIALREAKTSKEVILENALKSDLLVWTHTHGWITEGMEEIFRICKEKNIPTVGYHLDLFKGISREINLDTDPYWNIEYFFTADKNFVPDLKAKGIKAYYLPAGVVENECYMAEPDRQRFPHDIIFTGSKGYHNEWPYRSKLINWLQETYGDKFGHYGGDGIGNIRITGDDLNILYASAKIVIGDTLCKGFDYPDYFSDRLFEVTGRGGFMIFPSIEGLNDMFQVGNEYALNAIKDIIDPKISDLQHRCELVIYTFDNFDVLKNTIDYYLEHDEDREKIRLAGFHRTKKDHTYTKRLEYLLKTVFNK